MAKVYEALKEDIRLAQASAGGVQVERRVRPFAGGRLISGKVGLVNWIVTEHDDYPGRFCLQASIFRSETGYCEGSRENACEVAKAMAQKIGDELKA